MLVMVPTRGRRSQCERLLESFRGTAKEADLLFITDPDDQDTYAGMDWKGAEVTVLDPRGSLSEKLNATAAACADAYDVLMWAADDHVFETDGWDEIMLGCLAEMGGSGWVYPQDGRRDDVPEIWMCSTDIVKELGFFANPACAHYYTDNSVAELGRHLGLIRLAPVMIRHLHYSVDPGTERDETYRETEEKYGEDDLAAFRYWQSTVLPHQAARLRRKFSPEVRWILEQV